MKNQLIAFSIKLIIILGVVFLVHILGLHFLDFPLFNNMIVASYTINATLAILIFTVLYTLRQKFKTQLGFLFLAGSVLKFIIFFIVFYPNFKADNLITTLEFASFFIPYTLCLLIETISLSKWLNKMT